MRCKLALIFCVSFPVIMPLGCIGTTVGTGPSNQHEGSRVEVEPRTECLADGDLSNALKTLSFGNQAETDQAKKLLLDGSRKSEVCKKQIITALMKAMDKPNLDFKRDKDSYYLWCDGAELLGDLKAEEALDLLISHLDLATPKFSTSMNHMPALRAVIKIGLNAIPKLDTVLRHSPDGNMRHLAVYCMSSIGGSSAVRSLKEALPSESDPCVSRFIRVSIESLDNEHYSFAGDNTKWFSAFLCNG